MGIGFTEAEVTGNLGADKMAAWIPQLTKRMLGIVGYRAAIQLYDENFKGPKLTYHPRGETTKGRNRAAHMPASRSGRPMVNYKVFSKYLKISSFPMSLYEEDVKMGAWTRRGLHIMRNAKPALRIDEYAKAAVEKITKEIIEARQKENRA
jgi:hypothetical protein